jgi:hypothetical protein
MTDKTDTDPAVDWITDLSQKIATHIYRARDYEEGADEIADIIRTAYAETQAAADAREQRLVELEEENIELRRRLSKAMEF